MGASAASEIGVEFKRNLIAKAREELERINPAFVQAFQKGVADGEALERVIETTRPVLGTKAHARWDRWSKLLTAALDVEFAMDQVRRSLWLLEATPQGAPNNRRYDPGAWIVYHVDHWIFEMHAFLERLEKLVKLTCRSLVRPMNLRWPEIEKELMSPIAKIKKDIGKMRHPLAHGGGPVEAIEEEQLWEGFVLLHLEDFSSVVSGRYEKSAAFQQRWHQFLRKRTVTVLAAADAIFTKLNEYAFVSSGGRP